VSANVCSQKWLASGVQDYEPPSGELAKDIDATFGSLEAMQKRFNAGAAGVQGSGWGVSGYRMSLPNPSLGNHHRKPEGVLNQLSK
jgi:superoxide dismutase